MKTFSWIFVTLTICVIYVEGSENQKNISETVKPVKIVTKPKIHKRYIILSTPKNGTSHQCSAVSSEDFPKFLSADVLSKGGILLCVFFEIYCFTFLALICDGYFLPCVETICETLHLSPDVAAATFMSVATSAPELFTNLIGTFITQSDLGVGTIVGSSMFNTLGVAAIGSLAAIKAIKVDWWPLTRDVIIYVFVVSVLIVLTIDGEIYWYKALVLVVLYILYFIVMFQNDKISSYVRKLVNKKRVKDYTIEKTLDKAIPSRKPSIAIVLFYESYKTEEPIKRFVEKTDVCESKISNEKETSLFNIPKESCSQKLLFFYTWPLKLILLCLIPNPKKHRKLFPLTFILCIVFIGLNSYLVSWMMTIFGNLLSIPDAVLGMTFLAAGGCLPETISLAIMTRRGEGSMGVSNSLGANTMNILFSLGLPWFLKTINIGTSSTAKIDINSGSIGYTISALIPAASILLLTLYLNKFRLCKKVGYILLFVYFVFIAFAILAEMVFFRDKSICSDAA